MAPNTLTNKVVIMEQSEPQTVFIGMKEPKRCHHFTTHIFAISYENFLL